MSPVLLDSSFLIDLEHEIESGKAGPAMAWLRKNRTLVQRPLIVSSVTVAEYIEGCRNPHAGEAFIRRYITQNIGHQHATKCAELQRRARARGSRFGENDAWQLAVAERAQAAIVGRDRKAFHHLGSRYEQYAETP